MTFEIARTTLNETGSLESLTTKQLVDAYNAVAEKPVKKFQDRATALRRTEALVREKAVEAAVVEQLAPAFAQIDHAAIEKPKSATRSQAIMESWNSLDVHTKRRQRSAVRVKNAEGEVAEFRSVKQAFLALGLPMGKHIRFRMDLKAAGKLEAFGMEWTNLPLNY